MLRNIVFLALFFTAASTTSAGAVQQLTYSTELGPSATLKVSRFLQETNYGSASDYIYAHIDLNGDNIAEYIAKERECGNKSCLFMILAETKDEILLLSKIRAKDVMLGGTKTHGVTDVLIFESKINDYDFDIYIWSPSKKSYILKNE